MTAWRRPRILGVLNITADSFSDGGKFLDGEAAMAKALGLIEDGADLIDIGAAASNPDSIAVTEAEEIRRLDPVITALHARQAAVSIDSFRPGVQLHAMRRGVAVLNDIHGFPHVEIYGALAGSACRLILMHSVHGAAHVSRAEIAVTDVMATMLGFFETRLNMLAQAGIDRSRVILDPGMGYFLGANPDASFAALAGLRRLRAHFGLPVLVAVSRKSFLRAATGRENPSQAGAATLTAEIYSALSGVDYIRTHDVAALRDGLRVIEAVKAQETATTSGG